MKSKNKRFHPYIPNAVPEVQKEMLAEIGVNSIDELYQDIPEELRFRGKMALPPPLESEYTLKRHVMGILNKNQDCEENLSFLGGGCARHYVPAICDEINQRSEFLTAYAGEPFEDHGRFQALFEYQSLMAELLDVDVVNVPTFDWCQAAATSICMAGRITGRRKILIPKTIAPQRLAVIRNYCEATLEIVPVAHNPRIGQLDLADLRRLLTDEMAGIYFENPSYLGFLEEQGPEISDLVHRSGGLVVVGVDPISLGVIAPPSHYGADITCGDIQPLGNHISFGGGHGGFIGTRDEVKFVQEYPSRLFGLTRTTEEGEYGFGDVLYERTSFADREHSKEFVGTAAALCGITAGVYLALMGPNGMREIGETILQKSQYAMQRLNEIPGVRAPVFKAHHFKEFAVEFTETGKTVQQINAALRERGIFGGIDLSAEFPELGQSALYCVTEIHTKEDIDRLVNAMQEVVGN